MSDATHGQDRPLPLSAPAAAPVVLVVDDASADRDLHCLALRAWGLRPVAAADGWEGLLCARTIHPDLVITDVRMPGLDGWQLLARLRAAPTTADIPVLVVTGAAADAPPPADARAIRVLAKPVDLAALRRAIEGALAGRNA